MKIMVVTNDGSLIRVIENVEELNLNKPMPAADLISEIQMLIKRGVTVENLEER